MMFRNFIIVFVLLPFLTLTSSAQNNPTLAKQIIQSSVNKSKSYKSTKVEFKYILENKVDSIRDSQLGIFYLKDGNFKLTFGNQIILCDKKNVWTYLKDANEVQINTYNPSELEINPNEIFVMWETGYLYSYIGEQQINSKNVQAVELTPSDKNMPYFKVKLFIDKTSRNVVKMQTYYKNGTTITFDIKSIVPDIEIQEGFFFFNTSSYPGIHIIDLRE
jgi:outer membrane lipoprotein-sorting protein